eukprot:3662118-Pleurochrysis_carterae.AAC.1
MERSQFSPARVRTLTRKMAPASSERAGEKRIGRSPRRTERATGCPVSRLGVTSPPPPLPTRACATDGISSDNPPNGSLVRLSRRYTPIGRCTKYLPRPDQIQLIGSYVYRGADCHDDRETMIYMGLRAIYRGLY